jgi:hypothetical protein
MFMPISITSEQYNYKILTFYPHSIETRQDNRKAHYATSTEATEAAIKFLNKRGCVAKPIDLEGRIALVKISRS